MNNSLAYWCELQVAELMDRQERHGVNFNKPRASFLIHRLTEEILKVDMELVPQLPLMMHKADAYAKPFLKSGKVAKWPLLYCETHGIDPDHIGGPFSRIWFTPFDPSKTDRVKRVLIDHGWVPDEWNTKKLEEADDQETWIQGYITKNFIEERSEAWKDRLLDALNYKGQRTRQALAAFLREKKYIETSPKITEESLETVSGNVGGLVKRRVMLSHRRSLVSGLISKVREDGKLGAGCNPCATPTFRANYRVVVNIPRGSSLYGKDCRSLFIPDNKDHVMIGSDASGLEARMLCHYMDDMEYTDLLLNGDIHTFNQELAGLPSRDAAKTFLYALLYGAGDANLGAQVGGGKKEGALMRARFMDGLPKYAELVEKTKEEAESGYIVGLDGRPIRMRRGYDGEVQLHKALNTKLQSAGAIVMKYGMIFLNKWSTGLDAHQVIWSHDEVQWSVHRKHQDIMVHYMNNYVRVAGEYLNLNLPLASEAMVGNSWYATH